MNSLEKKLSEKFKTIPKACAPGFRLMVAHKGKIVSNIKWGKTWEYYDLASLTKIIFTTTQMMGLESQGKIKTNEPLNKNLKWYPFKSTNKQLLSHTAGNDWWQPFYKQLAPLDSLYEKKQKLKKILTTLRPKKIKKSVYSDIDFFLLGFLMEEVFASSLDVVWKNFVSSQLPKNKMHFNKKNIPLYKKSQYAPTEKCPWRKKTLQGEVHDENTWALQGVGAHAGLFGRVEDVMEWGLWLRQSLKKSNSFVKSSVAQKFIQRSLPVKQGDWALGFMMPTLGRASSGKYFSASSVGHTGFTGTSFWMDLEKDLIVVLLSNRINPTRQNEQFRKIRPQIHDMIVEALKGKL
ncbi:MAG: serine hydrolase [Bdellovibrionaceae bacterium]|nr:serine hydrolase [Pseudobdellovibrionaceae bacterium]